jgi:hypothetical protein
LAIEPVTSTIRIWSTRGYRFPVGGFDTAEVEKETGINLDEALRQNWEGDSYIVASQVVAQK